MGEQEPTIQENILAERYYAPGEKSWEDLAIRVGKFMGGTAITTAMTEKKFIPASPFLMNAGTEHPQMFSCFVLPLEDNIASIFQFYTESAKIFKSSGGVGANWSNLRPVGSPLSGGGTTSGVVSFMEIFNVVIEKVKQGGKKKGAAICTLDISHPEVENFIKMKLEKGKFENFNISPTVTDEFMQRAIAGHEYEKALFDLIVDCTYNSSEPGMLWIDTANRYCSTPGLGLYRSTNPCGERFLFPYECCCLGGINLAYFVRDGHVDWQNLGKTVRLVIRFLDEAFDRNEYPLPEIEQASKNTRRIGLYPIGLADALIKMRLPYDSQEGRDLAEKLWEFINKTAWDESVKLGEKLGTFPAYEARNPALVPEGARNAAVTCVAPGGTTSLIAGVNFGIEPYVGLVTRREQGSGTGTIVCPLFEEELRKVVSTEIEFNEVLDHAAKHGSIQSIDWLPADFKQIFVTARDIHWRDHIDMQTIFQKHCIDGTISKTINLPKSSTRDDIRDAYIYAWQQELRGLTFYREGTRDPVYAYGSGDEE
jgi:ribonucleoside-diphosphate reductase alpha chain